MENFWISVDKKPEGGIKDLKKSRYRPPALFRRELRFYEIETFGAKRTAAVWKLSQERPNPGGESCKTGFLNKNFRRVPSHGRETERWL